jgi:glutamyl-tRNA reductase
MRRVLLAGLNHTTAPLAMRERLAFDATQRAEALTALAGQYPGAEAVLLSTCNRVELYVAREVHTRPSPEDLADFLGGLRGVPVDQLKPHLYHQAEREAVEHLFRVVCSLDSMVIGETQILGQVREAYEAASSLGTAGAMLHPLFQRAVGVGKQVLSETSIAEGRVSVASVAVDYARRIFDHFGDKTVLSIGAGKMARLVLKSFASLQPHRLVVCNRTPEKAQALAGEFGGEAAGLDRLDEYLVAGDIVVCSTGSPTPVITRERFERLLRQRRYRPVFLIDIALPRDVEQEVGKLENVYLYNLDDLQQVVSATVSQRRDTIDAARAIVAGQVDQFMQWNRAREMGPLIERFTQRYHQLAREELERTLKKLGDPDASERAHLEELTRRIVNKLLHDPIKALRESVGPNVASPGYLHALERLFQLRGDVGETADDNDGES